MNKIKISVLLYLCLMAGQLSASTIQTGAPLPELEISDRGELLLQHETDFSYRPWHFQQNTGKVHVLQYMAGTMSASKVNKPFTDRLQKKINFEGYHVTTIINLDDALWGTGGFVVSEVKSSKRKYPLSTIVLDEDGVGLKRWQLQSKSSAIIILDDSGQVLYLKQGAMSEAEIVAALLLVQEQIGPTGEN